jgi:ADP-ribosylglycohydrolase
MNSVSRKKGALLGACIGDALAMPAHWYYNRVALQRDYGKVDGFLAPKSPHPDSILWRSRWEAPSPELDILGDQRSQWGKRGVHYHQNLAAGENTLTMKIAAVIHRSLIDNGGYDRCDVLRRYIDLLTHPARHRDTYIEECHRAFFTNLGRGLPAEKCAVEEKHIGGLAMNLPLPIHFADHEEEGKALAFQNLALTHSGDKMKVAAEAVYSLLYSTLRGSGLERAIESECQSQRNPHFGYPFFKWLEKGWSDEKVIGQHLSTACYVEDAVPAVIFLALKYARQPEEGLISNTNLGGDNVHRGAVLGALLGAENGETAWPERWTKGLLEPPDVLVDSVANPSR